MERPIKCSDSYNPYRYLEPVLQVFEDYAFETVVHEDGVAYTEPTSFGSIKVRNEGSFRNGYTYCFGSGMLLFKIRNNPFYDTFFSVDISHAGHGVLYLRVNLELDNVSKIENLIDIIKNTLHKYYKELDEAQRRAVMIASIID